jgi:hypothetical protein
MMREEQKSGSRAALFYTMKRKPRIKQVNSLLFIQLNICKFEKVEISLQISRVHDLYK